MRLILVRHGQTPSNVQRALDTGAPGAGLTALGHEQARALPGRLAPQLDHQEVGLLVTSNLRRTHETAEPLAQALGIRPVEDERIREIRAGDLEMRADEEAHATYFHTIRRWMAGELELRMPGAEDAHGVLARFDAAVEYARREVGAGLAVLVSHGAMIRTWAAVRSSNVPADWAAHNVVPNTGWIELSEEAGSWVVETWHGFPLLPAPARPGHAPLSDAPGGNRAGGRL